VGAAPRAAAAMRGGTAGLFQSSMAPRRVRCAARGFCGDQFKGGPGAYGRLVVMERNAEVPANDFGHAGTGPQAVWAGRGSGRLGGAGSSR